MQATLKVWRGAAGETGGFAHYEVPFEPGQTVLDGLRWIRVHRDPGLAIVDGHLRNLIGSCGLCPTRTSKCKCGPVARPL